MEDMEVRVNRAVIRLLYLVQRYLSWILGLALGALTALGIAGVTRLIAEVAGRHTTHHTTT